MWYKLQDAHSLQPAPTLRTPCTGLPKEHGHSRESSTQPASRAAPNTEVSMQGTDPAEAMELFTWVRSPREKQAVPPLGAD